MKQIELEPLDPQAFEDGEDIDASFPFLFPTLEERRKTLPSVVAQQWSNSSHYWFFYNGLCSKQDIQDFLRSQPLSLLETIAASFDIEAIDLVSEKRKKEGVVLSKADRPILIEEILNSITA